MYANKELWTVLYEQSGLLNCEEFWVRHSEHSTWYKVEQSIPEGAALIAIIPGRRHEQMRWSPTDRRGRSDQQRVDIWDLPKP